MIGKKQAPLDSPKSSGATIKMQFKNTKSILFFIVVIYSFLLQIKVISLFNNIIGSLNHE